MNISYVTEPIGLYAKAISAATNVEELCTAIGAYKLIASDALEDAENIANWDEFSKGLRMERRGRFAGEVWAEKYGAILMPEVMFQVGIIASKFKVPWGLAYIRAKETGLLSEKDGVAIWKGQRADGKE